MYLSLSRRLNKHTSKGYSGFSPIITRVAKVGTGTTLITMRRLLVTL